MTNPLNNLKQEAEKLRLSPYEKQTMLMELERVMRGRSIEDIPTAKRPSPYFFFSYQFTRVLAPALVLVLVAGVGTASAAQGSIPGDLLYPIKITVNETVEASLAFSAEARAEVHAKFAERRVEEAQTLAVRGALSVDIAEELEENFDTHVRAAEESVVQLAVEEPEVAAEVRARFASSIAANGAVLAELGGDSSNEETRIGSRGLSSRVIARAESGGEAASAKAGGDTRMALMVAPAASSTEDKDTERLAVAERMQVRVGRTLAEAKERYAALESTLDATTTTQVRAELELAAALFTEGGTALEEGRAEEGTAALTQALRLAVKLEALLEAQQKFDKGLLRSLIRGSEPGADDGPEDEDAEEEKEEGEPRILPGLGL